MVPEALNVARRHAGQVGGVRRGEVRQGIALEIGPEDLDRVEFGRVGRKQRDVAMPSMQVLRDDLGPVTRQSVPDENKGPSQMAMLRSPGHHHPCRLCDREADGDDRAVD